MESGGKLWVMANDPRFVNWPVSLGIRVKLVSSVHTSFVRRVDDGFSKHTDAINPDCAA